MLTALADHRDLVRSAVRDIYAPRSLPGAGEWCERHRAMAETGLRSARPGMFSLDHTPYFRQVFADLDAPGVEEITVCKSSQVGFSEVLIGGVLYCGAALRRPALVGFPTYDESRDFNKKRLIPAMHACPPAAALLDARGATESEIRLGGVPIYFSWAHSTKTFKSDPVATIFLDEIDEYPPGGEILSNARDRQRTFERRTLLKGSTPEDAETEGFVTQEYEAAAHRHRFCVPCPITGRYFELWSFDLIRWPGGRTADPDAAARACWLQSPFVHVPPHRRESSTEGRIYEGHKAWMVRHGLWLRQGEEAESDGRILETLDGESRVSLGRIDADVLREPPRHGPDARAAARRETTPEEAAALGLGVVIRGGDAGAAGRVMPASTRSYRINALASLIDTQGWGGVVRKGLGERFGPGWQKGTLGQAPRVHGDIASVRHLAERCLPVEAGGYAIGACPEPTAWVSVGIDVQKACVYALAIAFGPAGEDPALVEACRIERDERLGLTDVEADIAAMRFGLGRRSVRPMFVGVDSGHWTVEVYALIRRLRARGVRAWPTKGEAGNQSATLYRLRKVPEKDERDRPTGREHELLYLHADRWKTALFALLAEPGEEGDEGVRSLRLPAAWADDDGRVSRDRDDCLAQLTAERRVTKLVNGRVVPVWRLRREGLANHYLDAAVIAMAGARMRGAETLTAEGLAEIRRMAGDEGPSPARARGGGRAERRHAEPPSMYERMIGG